MKAQQLRCRQWCQRGKRWGRCLTLHLGAWLGFRADVAGGAAPPEGPLGRNADTDQVREGMSEGCPQRSPTDRSGKRGGGCTPASHGRDLTSHSSRWRLTVLIRSASQLASKPRLSARGPTCTQLQFGIYIIGVRMGHQESRQQQGQARCLI